MNSRQPWAGRKLHLVGICGAGMSGLARVAVELGAEVSGSDSSDGSVAEQLRLLGVEVTVGHRAGNLPEQADLVFSSAVGEQNVERVAAAEAGQRQLHRSELLGELTAMRKTVAVTGTHGKTTTTAMVVAALRGADLDPGYVVGAALPGNQPNAYWGTGDWLVVEADESDRSLLNLSVEVAVLTNCELDHHATYASIDDLEETFRAFLARSQHAVIWNRPELLKLASQGLDVVGYDAPDAVTVGRAVRFGWRGIPVELPMPGIHNAVNAVGALEVALLVGCDKHSAVAGLESFKGTGRRFEAVGVSRNGAQLVDDYAHHPTEVAATLAAARGVGAERVVAVFQPHLYSRTVAFASEFGAALATADRVLILDVYPARELADDFPGVSSQSIVEHASRLLGEDAVSGVGGLDAAAAALEAELQEGDLCVLMGAGDVGSLGKRLAV